MIRLSFNIQLAYEIVDSPADFVFNIHAAKTSRQQIVSEELTVNQRVAVDISIDPATANRYARLRANPGPLVVSYAATVDIDHHRESPARLDEVPIAAIPPQILPYI